MKKTAIAVTFGVILVAAGYLAYEKWYNTGSENLWDYVPNNAVLVFESKKPVGSWNELVESSLYTSLKTIKPFYDANTSLRVLDSIDGVTGSIAGLFKASLMSLHVTSKNDFDLMYYLDLNIQNNQNIVTMIFGHYRKKADITYSERLYQGYTISELSDQSSSFTYIINNNIVIGSFTSFLVEDVVRLLKSADRRGFKEENLKLFNMPRLANDDGDVYVNLKLASLWLGTFITSESRGDIKDLENLSNSSFFDFDISNDKLLFNGFTVANNRSSYLNSFRGQIPIKSNIKYYIPNRAAVLFQMGLSDASSWNLELENYWDKNNNSFYLLRNQFEKEYNYDFSKMYSWIGSNISFVQLESFAESGGERLVFIHTNDANEALNELNTFTESLAKLDGDTLYSENFSNYEIRELRVSEFPNFIIGPFFNGFEECYFTLIDDYVVLGNSMIAIKSLIEDIERENTWGRSVIFNKYLESNLEESNLSLTFNTSRVWESLVSNLDPKWKAFAVENEAAIKSFGLGSIQFSRLDDSFYTSIALQYEEQPLVKETIAYESLISANLNSKIITKPYVVKNHVDNSFEILVQDSSYNLILIGENGKVLWHDSIGQRIVSEIEQIDYYKNGKLQYFFATQSALHIVDRLGNNINGYPLQIAGAVKHARVVDYDKSKNYRFLVGDERGNLLLYSKDGVNLEGWDPRELSGKLASEAFHVRVRGKDCIVAIQQNGVVNVINRRGEMMPGFPLMLDERINTNPFVSIGSDFEKTIFTVLSKEGRLIKFNLNGIIMSTEQLYKPTKETTFKLVPDALGKTYVIAQQDLGRLVLFSSDNKEVLAKDYLSTNNLKVQHYDLASDHKIYAITDQTQGFTYIYNKDGRLISSRPIDSELEIGLLYSEVTKKYKIYCVSGNTFTLLTF